MTENKFYKPVGGLVRAELFHSSQVDSVEQLRWGGGVEVGLVDDASSYTEQFSADNRQVSVLHTLTLCSQQRDASPWLDKEFLRRVAVEGVVAEITLASGCEILVGWSERFAVEQALRLKSLNVISGKRPTDLPRVELTLWSHDTESAFV